ncbi:hypothetical protein JL100_018070 [Skermanella mucosa]|uniref:hypothetical protein n=1 Tax=Skermanella mucosa TaxID=1789672 RepID=UPI00192BB0C4|nr:hypothetical protein [Skermanella mucosa]UEM18993.1 hypothetical protein JL100_018070 [Skermanella mucosa]
MTMMTDQEAYALTHHDGHFRLVMPYAFIGLEHPVHRHVYLPLNRNYRPLGCPRQFGAGLDDIYDYLSQAWVFRRDPTTFTGIWWNSGECFLHLYDDSAESRKDYLNRYAKLLTKVASYRPTAL